MAQRAGLQRRCLRSGSSRWVPRCVKPLELSVAHGEEPYLSVAEGHFGTEGPISLEGFATALMGTCRIHSMRAPRSKSCRNSVAVSHQGTRAGPFRFLFVLEVQQLSSPHVLVWPPLFGRGTSIHGGHSAPSVGRVPVARTRP